MRMLLGTRRLLRALAPKKRTRLSSLLFLSLPLICLACPGGVARNDNMRAEPAASPSVVDSPAGAGTGTVVTAFDGDRAMEHVRKQIEIGPRPAGSAELARARDYIVGELKSYGVDVITDDFSAKTPAGQRRMVNITGELAGDSSDIIMMTSHYDTKLFKEFRFVGANDGGSSTGTVLELARVIAANKQKPKFTYRFVFFDGEEAVCKEWEECGKPNAPDNTYGSRRYVDQLREKNELKRVRAMVLLDMMGFKNLQLGRDDMSTVWLVDTVWQTGRKLGYGSVFVDRAEGVGGDDHEPFLKAGIDSLDIIQLNSYPYWHTAEDTLDKVSPKSLKIVGDVLLSSLPGIEQHLSGHRGA
jgi:glutaminyl-peptide cyclotransferase